MKTEINYKKELVKGALAGIGATFGTALLFWLMSRNGGNNGGSI